MKPLEDPLCLKCGEPRDVSLHRTALGSHTHAFVAPVKPCEHNFAVAVEFVSIDSKDTAVRATKLACTHGCGTLHFVTFDQP